MRALQTLAYRVLVDLFSCSHGAAVRWVKVMTSGELRRLAGLLDRGDDGRRRYGRDEAREIGCQLLQEVGDRQLQDLNTAET